MAAPDKIERLVEIFDRNLAAYKSSGYKEANVRSEFIDPFFEALGWDVRNKQGYAEAYKDVITEDAIKVGGVTKAPDYCFRIGGARKFFVEAKKPSVDIKGEISPAYQLRRYAWSAGLPLSILTDFEEFAVYDCRIRPRLKDKSGTARVIYLTYKDYLEKWDEIGSIFSKQAVLEGLFDKYVESKGKRTTQEVDSEFLKEIENWRTLLARTIALRNPSLGIREINFAVQRTIDRIIFLRICEDRGIERYGQLQALLNGTDIYERLVKIYRLADDKYNSGLFHFHREKDSATPPDELTPGIKIDDKVLKEIFKQLYYPESPYEFSVLSVAILGNIYEQFLGKVITLTKGHQAKVEEKPEVRKAGGVYYTPTYIVDYIVKNTVGKLCEGKTPKQIEKLRILDPACGSGSFLIGAYTYLTDYHRDWYLANLIPQLGHEGYISKTALRKYVPGQKPEMPIYQGKGGQWYLTTREKKRILLNNIYGVDIDSQAVEVTKLSLLLKVLENENQDTLERQMKLWRERALPDLGNNIKCGNSLIGPDFYEGEQLTLLDDEEQSRINAFDWTAEFPEIMQKGGFDAVIGNPPYIRIQTLKESSPKQVAFFKQHYNAAGSGNYDIYVVFVEKGLNLLNKKGRLGFILPHKFFNSKYGEPLRGLIAGGKNLAHVVHFGDQQVFAGATTYTALMFLDKGGNDSFELVRVNDLGAWRLGESQPSGEVKAGSATAAEWNFVVGAGAVLFARLAEMPVKLRDIANIFVGLQTSADTVFLFKDFKPSRKDTTEVVSVELGETVLIETAILKRVIRSGSIGRYHATPTALVLFPYEVKGSKARLFTPNEMKNRFPLAWIYLTRHRELLAGREHGKFRDAWYQLYPKNLGIWEQPKLMIPYMITDLAAYLDREDNYYFVNVTTGGFGLTNDEKTGNLQYLCALLNSRLLDFYFKRIATTFHGGYFAANKQYIGQLPIYPINFSDIIDKVRHDKMVALAEQVLSLNKQLSKAKTPNEKTRLNRKIKVTNNQINQLVYELYGLTDKEIRIVEKSG